MYRAPSLNSSEPAVASGTCPRSSYYVLNHRIFVASHAAWLRLMRAEGFEPSWPLSSIAVLQTGATNRAGTRHFLDKLNGGCKCYKKASLSFF